jgi:hypothetical protein
MLLRALQVVQRFAISCRLTGAANFSTQIGYVSRRKNSDSVSPGSNPGSPAKLFRSKINNLT